MAKTASNPRPRPAASSRTKRRNDGVSKREAHGDTNKPVLLKVTGWRNSKAVNNADGEVTSLIKFLERHGTSAKQAPARIRKSRVQTDTLIITVSLEDEKFFRQADSKSFAGNKIKVEHMSTRQTASITSQSATDTQDGVSSDQLMLEFAAVLTRRYNSETHLLDLSALGKDPDLVAMGITNIVSRANFFPALMKVCSKIFANKPVESIILTNNDLLKVTPIRVLADTFPDLKNLDLSCNKFKTTLSFAPWEGKLPALIQLYVKDMEFDANAHATRVALIQQFPSLKDINGIAVTPEEHAAATAIKALPPSLGPMFEDTGDVAKNFICAYFSTLDSDRPTLARDAYDEESTLTISVNMSGLDGKTQPAKEWSTWLPFNHNLQRVNNPTARRKRRYRGKEQIAKVLSEIPGTRHPGLFNADAAKWLIDCRLQQCLPDPSGQAPNGVAGFLINIHGEFDELNKDGSPTQWKRSFDRTLVIGPGGPTGVRIINDLLSVRPYTGFADFAPELSQAAPVTQSAAATLPQSSAQISQSIISNPQADPALAEKMALITALQQQTGLKAEFAEQCLQAANGNLQQAMSIFESQKQAIPADAFVQL